MNQETTKGIFNKMADSYDTPERERVLGIIKKELIRLLAGTPRESVLLDYGCGTGLMSLPFEDRFESLFLVDIAEEMVEQVKQKCQVLGLSHVKAQILEQFQANEEKVDVIFVIQTLLHIPDTSQVFKELAGRLKEGGRLIIVDVLKNDQMSSHLIHHGFSEEE
ncbi:class I SAM-dependent methyltransferase [Streptococcus pneumoniae]